MTRISDVVDMTFGFAFKSAEFSDEPTDVRLLRGDNIAQGRLRWGGAKRFPKTRVGEVERYQMAVGDVVIAMDRPWIEAGLKYSVVREEDVPSLLVQRVARLRTKSDSLDQGFLAAVIGSAAFTNYVIGVQTGSAVPHISGGQIGDFEFKLPTIGEQRAIAATLGALDDKIESSRRAVAVALSLATASYERAALSASRERLGEHATLVLGGTPSRKRPELWENGSIPWIASGAANAEIVMQPTELITQDALAHSAAKMMPKGATVIAITGATLGQVALLGIDTSGNQSLVGVWADKPALTTWLHLALRASMNDLVKSATGAAQQHVNKGNVAELMVPILEEEELDEWAAVNVPLIERCVQLEAESQRLTALRDTLLPELLSGRMRVPVEGVAA